MTAPSRDRYVVDGRFLTVPPTGLHRVAREFVLAARDAGLDAEVWAPGGGDPLVDRVVPVPGGRLGGRAWEQLVLPALAGRRPIWSLTNTAPLLRPGTVVVHDLAATIGPQWFAGSMRAYAAAVLRGARRARRVITVSRTVETELTEHGVRPERIVVVPPRVSDGFRPAVPEAVAAVRARYGLNRDYALLVGWADPRKDAATAVAAHLRVAADVPHDLVLVGRAHPTFAPVELPAVPSVRRLGAVPDDDLVPLLSGAAVLLYPSRYEGFGLPPLEALACGTPAVASDIAALRESTAGLVRLEPVGDTGAWAAALRDALAGGLSCPSPPLRTRRSLGRQLVDALSSGPAG